MLNASRRYGTAMQEYGRRSLTHFGEALARIVALDAVLETLILTRTKPE